MDILFNSNDSKEGTEAKRFRKLLERAREDKSVLKSLSIDELIQFHFYLRKKSDELSERLFWIQSDKKEFLSSRAEYPDDSADETPITVKRQPDTVRWGHRANKRTRMNGRRKDIEGYYKIGGRVQCRSAHGAAEGTIIGIRWQRGYILFVVVKLDAGYTECFNTVGFSAKYVSDFCKPIGMPRVYRLSHITKVKKGTEKKSRKVIRMPKYLHAA